MAYIPQRPPSATARNARAVIARPSGGLFDHWNEGNNFVRVVNMPRGGRLLIDGQEWMAGGRWSEENAALWMVPNPPDGRVLRVVDAAGNAREFDNGASVAWSQAGEIDWATMTPVAGAPVASPLSERIAVRGMPHGGQVLVNGTPAEGRWEDDAMTLWSVPAPMGLVSVAVDANGTTRQSNATRGGVLDYATMSVQRRAGDAGTTIGDATASLLLGGGATPGLGTPTINPATASAAQGRLVVNGPAGWALALALPGQAPFARATIDRTMQLAVPGPVGDYVLTVTDPASGRSGSRAFRLQGTVVIDARDVIPAPAPAAPAPAAPVTARLTVVGPPGWRVGVGAPGGNGDTIAYGPLPASGAMALDLTPGPYALRVDTDHATGRLDVIDVPAGGRSIDARTWVPAAPASPAPSAPAPASPAPSAPASASPAPSAPASRGSQGPTAADPAKGTILLRGAPGQSAVAVPGASLTWTVDDSGRPVALDVAPGTYALTVAPPGSARRASSVTVAAGQTTEVVYGTMPAPASQTSETGLQTVDAMCGPVLGRLAWMPPTACPGEEFTAPDGTRYRALAASGGVQLLQLKADGTLAASGWSTTTKVLLVGGVVAAGAAAWWLWSQKDSPRENPGKSRCSCQGH